MKNYYEILKIQNFANIREVKEAYNAIPVNQRTPQEEKALKVLGSKSLKDEYDKKLKSSIETKEKRIAFLKKNKVKVAVGSAFLALIVSGTAIKIGTMNANEKNSNNKITSIPTPTSGAFGPEVPDYVKDRLTPTPIIPENVLTIDSDNIDYVVKYIVETDKKQKLSVDAELVKMALIISNISSISKEELLKIVPEADDALMTRLALLYKDEVVTHNIKALYTDNMSNYISFSNLSYNQNDVDALEKLDEIYLDLVSSIKNKKITEKEYLTTLKTITDFYEGKAGIELADGKKAWYKDLTTGGKFLAEATWPMLSVAFTECSYYSDDVKLMIYSMETNTIDGVKWQRELNECGLFSTASKQDSDNQR